jgi:hypothetical protein
MSSLLLGSRLWFPLCLGLLLVGGACQSDDFGVSTTADPLARFPRQATFAWDAARSDVPDEPRVAKLEFERNLREQAETAFAARGYRVIADGEPDYHLAYQLNVHHVVGGELTRAVGSLWLTLRERGTDRSVWTGAARADIHVGLSPQERRIRIQKMLDAMLEDFPPEQRGS